MKESIQSRVNALTARAKQSGGKAKISPSTRNGSSLHKIIRTKEQADVFMKLLKSS